MCAQVAPSQGTCHITGTEPEPQPTKVPATMTPTPTPTKAPTMTPTPTRVPTAVPTTTNTYTCATNADCRSGEQCYQPPMPACPEGRACPQVMPSKICVATTPPASPTPAPVCTYTYSEWSTCSYGVQTRTIVGAANKVACKDNAPVLQRSCVQTCTNNSQCGVGEYCASNARATSGVNSSQAPMGGGTCAPVTKLVTDVNGDGMVNVLDLSFVIKYMFQTNTKADINGDGTVDVADYSLVLRDMMSKGQLQQERYTLPAPGVIEGGG